MPDAVDDERREVGTAPRAVEGLIDDDEADFLT
jgi:hypothetical protein